jgi:tetratricopeptide (TPR) repeat protein
MELKDYNAASTLLRRVEEYHRMNADLLSTVGRMYLIMGDVLEAEFVFDRVATFEDASITLNLMNAGFLHTARGEWDRARESFAEVLKREPQNKQAENNLAVALLYQGKLDEGIRQLERRMESSKNAASLSAGPILNLCTLYELRTGDSGLLRKRELLRGVSEIAGDDLPTECFKLAV